MQTNIHRTFVIQKAIRDEKRSMFSVKNNSQ